jgi:hypothetical protein
MSTSTWKYLRPTETAMIGRLVSMANSERTSEIVPSDIRVRALRLLAMFLWEGFSQVPSETDAVWRWPGIASE